MSASTAVVVYVSPKYATDYTRWCLEPVAGTPGIRRFFDRVIKGFPAGEFEFVVVCHEAIMPPLLSEALSGTPAKVYPAQAPTPVAALAEALNAHPHLKTILLFPEGSIFPDCRLAARMLEAHRKERAEATGCDDFPEGLVPEVLESAAIKRLAGIGLQESGDFGCVDYMKKSNELFEGDKELGFKLFRPKGAFFSPAADLEALPAQLLINDRPSRCAAEAVAQKTSGRILIDASEAVQYKEERRRQREHPTFVFADRRPSPGQLPILFSTQFHAYSGAEESWFVLIAHLDKSRFYPVVALPNEGLFAEKLRAAGVHVEVAGQELAVHSPETAAYFNALIDSFGIRLIHINGSMGGVLELIAFERKIPLVTHVRTLVGRKAPEEYRYASALIAISKAAARDLARSDIDAARTHVVYGGVQEELFESKLDRGALRAKAGIPAEAPVISMIARLTPQKRHEVLLRALPEVLKKFPKTLALLVGENHPKDAAYAARLQGLIKEIGLESCVRLWGYEKNIAEIHAISDALVLCSDDEAFGRCAMEAMAMGAPVVVTRGGGLFEVIKHYENGVLYDAGNVSQLATELIRLLGNPDIRQKIGQNAKRTAREAMSIGSHVAAVTKVYDSIL